MWCEKDENIERALREFVYAQNKYNILFDTCYPEGSIDTGKDTEFDDKDYEEQLKEAWEDMDRKQKEFWNLVNS